METETETETAHHKAMLEKELVSVTEELKTLGVHNPANIHDWIATPEGTEVGEADENVSADHAEELEERTALLADLERRYNDTLRALEKIKNGAYGICEVSGHAIEPKRLDANPAARTCIEHMNEENLLSL